MRQRAISAAVLVPVLLVVLALGGVVLAAAVALVTVLAAIEVFRLLKAAGYGPFVGLGTALALVVVLDAAFPEVLDGSGLLLVAVGIMLVAVAAFSKVDPHDGLQTWMSTVFGALYISLLAFIIRLGHAAPDIPAGSPLSVIGAERGWILLLILTVWAYDTGAFLVGKNIGRTKFLTHISPSKTIEGLVGGVVASTIVVAILLWGLGQNPAHALVLGPLTALAAQAGDLAELVIKRAAGAEGFRHAHPGPRRDARPRGFVRLRRAGRDPVCPRPHPLNRAGQGPGAAPRRAPRIDRLDRSPGRRRPGRAPGCLQRGRPRRRLERGAVDRAGRAAPTHGGGARGRRWPRRSRPAAGHRTRRRHGRAHDARDP